LNQLLTRASGNGVLVQPDTQCTHNVTLRCVHVTVVAVENQTVLNIFIECLLL